MRKKLEADKIGLMAILSATFFAIGSSLIGYSFGYGALSLGLSILFWLPNYLLFFALFKKILG